MTTEANAVEKYNSYHRLVDYFIVCGLNKSVVVGDIDKTYQVEILDRYPQTDYDDAPFPTHIWMFCFPAGLTLKPVAPEPSISMFCLTEFDGARFYASSLVYYKEIPKSHIESDHSTLYKPISITLLSRYPFYKTLKELLCYIYTYSLKSNLCISNKSSNSHDNNSSINFLNIERIISNIVNDLPRPIEGYRMVVDLPYLSSSPHINNINYSKSIQTNNLPDLDIPFHLLFHLLGLRNAIKLFSFALHERKILFLSSNSSLLTVACETLTYLLYPFVWHHVYIPILPDLLIDFLQAPTPFIVGMIQHPSKPKIDYQDIVVVDLDNQELNCSNLISNVPECESLKLENELRRILYPDLDTLSTAFPVHRDDGFSMNQQIRSAFLAFFVSFFYDIDEYRYLLRKYPTPITTFNKSSFLMKHSDPSIVTFLSELIETSGVTSFFDNAHSNSNNNSSNNNNSNLNNSTGLSNSNNSIGSNTNNTNNNNTNNNNNSSNQFFDLICKYHNSNINRFSSTYESVRHILKKHSNSTIYKTVQIPSPDSSELNLLVTLVPQHTLSFPDLNHCYYSTRTEYSKKFINTVPNNNSHSHDKKEGIENLLPDLTLTPTSVSPSKRSSIVMSTPSTPTTTSSNPIPMSIVDETGSLLPILSEQQLQDQELLKEFIEKYIELIFSPDDEGSAAGTTGAIDTEQQVLLLDILKLKNARQYFVESLTNQCPAASQKEALPDSTPNPRSSLGNIYGKKILCLETNWKLTLLVEIMKRVFSECNHSADFKTASLILKKSQEIYFKTDSGHLEHLYILFSQFKLWKNFYFWESFFFEGLVQLRREQLPASFNNLSLDWDTMTESVQNNCIQQEEDVIFKSLSTYAHLMIRLKIPMPDALRFIGRMVIMTNLSDDQYNTLTSLVEKIYQVDSINSNTGTTSVEINENGIIVSTNTSVDDINLGSVTNGEEGVSSANRDVPRKDSVIPNAQYFSTSVKRNIEIEKNGGKQYYQKLIDIKRKKGSNSSSGSHQHQGGTMRKSSSSNTVSTEASPNSSFVFNEPEVSSEKRDGYNVTTLKGSGSALTCLGIHEKRSMIVSGTSAGHILMWNYSDGRFIQRLTNHKSTVNCLGLDQKVLDTFCSGSKDKTLRIWNYNNSEWGCYTTLQEHTGEINCLDMKRNIIVTGSQDQSMIMWDARQNRLVHKFTGHSGNIISTLILDKKDMAVTTSSDNTTRIWDLKTHKTLHVLQEHHDWVTKAIAGGKYLFTGGFDCIIKVWDIATGKSVKTLSGHAGGINCLSYDEDKNVLISGSGDGFLKAWDVSTGYSIKSFKGHKDEVLAVVYRGETMISSSQDQTIRVWDVSTGVCHKVLRGHTDWVKSLSNISSPVNKFVSASWDSTVKIWDIESTNALRESSGSVNSQLLNQSNTNLALKATSTTPNEGSFLNFKFGSKSSLNLSQHGSLKSSNDSVSLKSSTGSAGSSAEKLHSPPSPIHSSLPNTSTLFQSKSPSTSSSGDNIVFKPFSQSRKDGTSAPTSPTTSTTTIIGTKTNNNNNNSNGGGDSVESSFHSGSSIGNQSDGTPVGSSLSSSFSSSLGRSSFSSNSSFSSSSPSSWRIGSPTRNKKSSSENTSTTNTTNNNSNNSNNNNN
ncbi:hypothetical protein CYY_002883 [Polysphondylium violaceum]|uniref:UDENN domain-containing protein n=1 Tax=Polysphondylium violaceum TaxID=133409 RepID=A0A8J4PYK3_9MYCE|nr:hypothetical protein CYY_002883 [Polysphondylium violaceum]